MFWFSKGLVSTRLNRLETEVGELKAKIDQVDQRFTRVTKDVLEATETLDRITKRSFRLKEQLLKLEEEKQPEPQKTLTRADILRNAVRG